MAYLVLVLLGLLLIGAIASARWRRAWRRHRVRRTPFPAEWRAILRSRVPIFRRLPAHLQLQLKKQIQVFIAEKRFIGCGGLEVDDEVRVVIAAQACLLLLNRRADHFAEYFARLTEVLVYPGQFVVARSESDAGGVLHERRNVLSGESWVQGQVVLSWDDVLAGAADADDGRNVVIHEFAHQLDQEKGQATGAPLLGGRERQQRWSQVLAAAYARLHAQLARADTGAQAPVLDPYGATSPAEFFAVASEVFFERPQALADAEPALYEALAGCYRVDPRDW